MNANVENTEQDTSASEPVAVTDNNFAQQAEEARVGLVAEFLDFLIHNKKWWLTPIIVVLLLVGVLVFFTSTAVAPFIYTL